MILYNNFKILNQYEWYPILYTMSDSEDPIALIDAIRNRDHPNDILKLIQSEIDVNKQDWLGWTALMATAVYGGEHAEEIMRGLVDAGADVNKQLDKQLDDERTALMIAAEYGGEHAAGMMRLLVDAGADVNKQDKKGWTALMITIMYGFEHAVEMMRLLVDAGGDTNMQNKFGETALIYAAEHGREHAAGMINLLLDAGADVNKQDEYGQTILMLATMYGREHAVGVIRILIDAKSDINKQCEKGTTALMWSLTNDCEHVAEITHTLVNAGADINIKNDDNKTVYDIAKEKNYTIAVNLLQQYKNNWIFKWNLKNNLQLKLWSEQNIQIATTIILCWKKSKSKFCIIPWDLIREYILPMTIDRKDTIKLLQQ